MLKRNLIIMAIMSLVLIFTSNAFGQWREGFDGKARVKKSVPKTTKETQYGVKSPRDMASGGASKTNRQSPRVPKNPSYSTTSEDLAALYTTQSPRNPATGQVTGKKQKSSLAAKKKSGIVTETTMPVKAKTNSPQSKSKRQVKWYVPEMDADSSAMLLKKSKTKKSPTVKTEKLWTDGTEASPSSMKQQKPRTRKGRRQYKP